MTSDSLQQRLIAAILAAGAAACGKSTASTSTANTAIPPPVTVESENTPSCMANTKRVEMCLRPFSKTAAAQGTGEPAPAPPASAYDLYGCLPHDRVTDGCCNPAISGPRVSDGKCCYDVCTGACCGRPFLVDGAPRVAAIARRSDWLAGDVAIDPEHAPALRDAWVRDAQMEHASAAAFGRFMLQLLALGAPPNLVRDAARAAADEVRHAELCFALASRFGGEPVGPAPLAIDGALGACTLDDVVALVVAEGCVGETIAALSAARQLEGATDPAVRRALEEIRADEAAHAELAWSFVAWACANGARAAAEAAFERALRQNRRDCAEREPDLRAFGRLTAAERRDVERSALADVIAPCARQLLEA